jgi:hypothetical protein
MLSVNSPLATRTTSSFPISIGTALSLETLFDGSEAVYDKDRVIPSRINITAYSSFYINLVTLIRNIIGSVSSKDSQGLLISDIAATLEHEVSIIKDLVKANSSGLTKCVFYMSRYKGLERKHPHAILRIDNTEKQRQTSAIIEKTLNEFIKTQVKGSVEIYDLEIEPKGTPKAIILTNYAYDLLSYKRFETLDLIESHTGVLKKRNLWNTKLYNGKTLPAMPFCAMTMQVFGDSQTFVPMPSKGQALQLKID